MSKGNIVKKCVHLLDLIQFEFLEQLLAALYARRMTLDAFGCARARNAWTNVACLSLLNEEAVKLAEC